MPSLRAQTGVPAKSKAAISPLANQAYTRWPSVAGVTRQSPCRRSPGRFGRAGRRARDALLPEELSIGRAVENLPLFLRTAPVRKRWSWKTTGELFPSIGTAAFQRTFSPFSTFQAAGMLAKAEIPVPPGPRKQGQLLAISSLVSSGRGLPAACRTAGEGSPLPD